MGIFILSLVLAAMDVKKLLNMFAISIGSVLVVSLETRILGIFDWLLFIFKIDFIPFPSVFNVVPISFKVMISNSFYFFS